MPHIQINLSFFFYKSSRESRIINEKSCPRQIPIKRTSNRPLRQRIIRKAEIPITVRATAVRHTHRTAVQTAHRQIMAQTEVRPAVRPAALTAGQPAVRPTHRAAVQRAAPRAVLPVRAGQQTVLTELHTDLNKNGRIANYV